MTFRQTSSHFHHISVISDTKWWRTYLNELSPPQRPLCVVGRLGRREKKARGARWEGERERAPAFSLFPSSSARLLFFDYCSFYRVFSLTWQRVCIRKEFNSYRNSLWHQHGSRFIVLGHKYGRRDVMWKHSIGIPSECNKPFHCFFNFWHGQVS